MALLGFDHVVDGQVLEPRALGQQLAVGGLADAGGAGDDDIGECARHCDFFCLLCLSLSLFFLLLFGQSFHLVIFGNLELLYIRTGAEV